MRQDSGIALPGEPHVILRGCLVLVGSTIHVEFHSHFGTFNRSWHSVEESLWDLYRARYPLA